MILLIGIILLNCTCVYSMHKDSSQQNWIPAKEFAKNHGASTWLALEILKKTSIDDIPKLELKIPEKVIYTLFKVFYPEMPSDIDTCKFLEGTNTLENIIDKKDHRNWYETPRYLDYGMNGSKVNRLRVKGAFKHICYVECSCNEEKHRSSHYKDYQKNNYWTYNFGNTCHTGNTSVELITEDGNTKDIVSSFVLNQKKNRYVIIDRLYTYQIPKKGGPVLAFEDQSLIGDTVGTITLQNDSQKEVWQSTVESNINHETGKCGLVIVTHEFNNGTNAEKHFVSIKAESGKRIVPFMLYTLGRKIQKENLLLITQSNKSVRPMFIDISFDDNYRDHVVSDAYTELMTDIKERNVWNTHPLQLDLKKTYINPALNQKKSFNEVTHMVTQSRGNQKQLLNQYVSDIVQAYPNNQWLRL